VIGIDGVVVAADGVRVVVPDMVVATPVAEAAAAEEGSVVGRARL
jgi:hypothetical protein